MRQHPSKSLSGVAAARVQGSERSFTQWIPQAKQRKYNGIVPFRECDYSIKSPPHRKFSKLNIPVFRQTTLAPLPRVAGLLNLYSVENRNRYRILIPQHHRWYHL